MITCLHKHLSTNSHVSTVPYSHHHLFACVFPPSNHLSQTVYTGSRSRPLLTKARPLLTKALPLLTKARPL